MAGIQRPRTILLAALAALSFLFFLEKGFLPGISPKSSERNFSLLESVLRLIQNDYLEEKTPTETMDGALRGLVNTLDASSAYLNKESTARYQALQTGQTYDIGVVLFMRYGLFPQVVGVLENSPAEKQGVRVGDFITEIDGRPTSSLSLAEASLYLRDGAADPTRLKILRQDKTFDFNVGRIQLFPDLVAYSPQKDTAGVLKIHALLPPAAQEVRKKYLSRLQNEKKPLIIDLRNCAWGTVEEARQFIGLFLKAEQIGFFEGRGGAKEILSAPGPAELEGLPLIIWLNQASLGPAEVVAAVLKEYRKAKVIGQPTPGLAARHKFIPLQDGTSLLITSGVFCLKQDEKVWGQGVSPDVKLEPQTQDTAAYLEKTMALLTSL